MPRDGQGNYTLPAGNPYVNGTTADATVVNTTLSDIAGALTNSLAKDGQTPATNDLALGNNKITGLKNGTLAQDAVTVAQLAQVVGTSRNLKASQTAAASTLTFTADEIVLQKAIGGLPIKLANFNQTIDVSTNSAINGMEGIVQAPASSYVSIYAMYNSTTGQVGLLGVDATSAAVPECYGGTASLGYDYSALISVWGTDSTQKLLVGDQLNRTITRPEISIINGTGVTTGFVSLTIPLPYNAKMVSGLMYVTTSAADTVRVDIASASTGTGKKTCYFSNPASSFEMFGNFSNLVIRTAKTIFYSISRTNIGNTVVQVNEYTI